MEIPKIPKFGPPKLSCKKSLLSILWLMFGALLAVNVHFVTSSWETWSPWSPCSVTCGSSFIHRTRNCSNPPDCIGGKHVESKECLIPRCSQISLPTIGINNNLKNQSGGADRRLRIVSPKTGVGSIIREITETKWLNWGPCSVTCGQGIRQRAEICSLGDNHCLIRGKARIESKICIGRFDCSKIDIHSIAWSEWKEWSECSVSCGKGYKVRGRFCLLADPDRCMGHPSQTQPCTVQSECSNAGGSSSAGGGNRIAWSQWTEWGSCSVTCGRGGTTRTRRCLAKAELCTPDGGNTVQARHCDMQNCITTNGGKSSAAAGNTVPSSAEVVWKSWGPWEACSKSCGDGIRFRRRSCASAATSASAANLCERLDSLESRMCHLRRCDEEIVGKNVEIAVRKTEVTTIRNSSSSTSTIWTLWSGWSDCSITCGPTLGFRRRTRSCLPSSNQGPRCRESLQTRTEICRSHISSCNIENGVDLPWGPWGPCSVTCSSGKPADPTKAGGIQSSSGQKTRTRHCPLGSGRCTILHAAERGSSVPRLAMSQTITCTSSTPCPDPFAPFWSEWGSWGPCSPARVRTRMRICSVDNACSSCDETVDAVPIQTEHCNVATCLSTSSFDSSFGAGGGGWTDWQPWTKCSNRCGQGAQLRFRSCALPKGKCAPGKIAESRICQGHDDTDCPPITTRENLDARELVIPTDENPSPLSGVSGGNDWSTWGSCSATCGRGAQSRFRFQVEETRVCFNGPCFDDRNENDETISIPLPQDPALDLSPPSPWGEWSPCSSACGSGTRSRSRLCIPIHEPCNDLKIVQNSDCVGSYQCRSENGGSGDIVEWANPGINEFSAQGDVLPVSLELELTNDGQAAKISVGPHWTQWTAWTQCSTQCGTGTKSRSRTCSEGRIGNCGEGLIQQDVKCFANNPACQSDRTTDSWTHWGPWGPCSVRCGAGTRSRSRRCPTGVGRCGRAIVSQTSHCQLPDCDARNGPP